MIYFETAINLIKKVREIGSLLLVEISRRELMHIVFIALLFIFYVVGNGFKLSEATLLKDANTMKDYQKLLNPRLELTATDSAEVSKEKELVLMAIEERLGVYLHHIPDYTYVWDLQTYLKHRPELLHQFPSCVPLEKGEYALSSAYGMRIHPISKKAKTHFGVDLAAASGKPVYASAVGTVTAVILSDKGYGNHIIIKHRFGFQTVYGHLKKILVQKGQAVTQHELLGHVGSSGNSTGFHLHYEVWKNGIKIDPRPSFNLKKTIYTKPFVLKTKEMD
jgi:murein DD-endopeptidase MepM/ murein hydrolase activator NlpD